MFELLGDMYTVLLEVLNLLCAGILAGIEIAIHYGFYKPTLLLDEKPQIMLRQQLTRKLRWLVPAFFLPMAISGIAITVVDWNMQGHYARLAAVACIVVWIIIRIIGTVPVNSAVIEWNPTAPPKDWEQQIGKVERFHVMGTWAAIIAFACFLIALAQTIL